MQVTVYAVRGEARPAFSGGQNGWKNQMTSLLIRNARIVDGSGDQPTDPVDIAIEDGRFVEVGKDIGFAAAGELDLKAGIVMPGLIDCHVHVIATTANLGQNAELPNSLVALLSIGIMQAMLQRGFTTVRDLGGADIGLQMAIEDGLVEGPRLVICGKALSQSGGHCDYRGAYHSRDVNHYADRLGALGRLCDGVPAVQKAAREEIKNGAQFIKVMADGGVSSPSDPIGYLVFSVDELQAAVEVAEGFGTYVAAHLYDDRAIVRALDCGITCVEHSNLIGDQTIARIASEGQVVVPTTVTYQYLATEGPQYGLPPESVAKVADVRDAGLDCLSRLHEAGVVIGYGTDLLGGMHVHQSQEFVLRGHCMPAHDAIRSATLDAAKVLRMEGEIGTIAPGAHADLICLDGNPLQNLELLCGQGKHMPLIVQGGAIRKNTLN